MKDTENVDYRYIVNKYFGITKEKQLKPFFKDYGHENQLKESGVEILFLLSRICELNQFPHAAVYYYSEIIFRQNEIEEDNRIIQAIEEIDNVLDFSTGTNFPDQSSFFKFVFLHIIKNLELCGIKDEKDVAQWFGGKFMNLDDSFIESLINKLHN